MEGYVDHAAQANDVQDLPEGAHVVLDIRLFR